jgi:hypothetical protein
VNQAPEVEPGEPEIVRVAVLEGVLEGFGGANIQHPTSNMDAEHKLFGYKHLESIILAVFGGMGVTVSPTVRSYILSAAGASPEPRRRLAVVPCLKSRVLRRVSGEAPVRPARRSGAWLEEPGAGGSTA